MATKKIWCARDRVRRETATLNTGKLHQSGLTSLYSDGRKDKTCLSQSSVQTEERVVVLSEPGGRYATHFTPESGRAPHLLTELYSVSQQFGGHIKVLLYVCLFIGV